MNFADFIYSNAFVLMFFPIWVAFLITLNFLIPNFRSKHFTVNLTLISTGICVIYSILLFYITSKTGIMVNNDIIEWFRIGNISFSFGFLLDNLSAFFLVIYTLISFIIQLYSYQYVKEDENFYRYFVCLNMLNFSISGLIISTNLIQSCMFLAGTSICSYMLISFWYKKKSVSDISKKYLILNSFGDCSILLSVIFYVYFAAGFYEESGLTMLNFSSIFDLSHGLIPFSTHIGFSIICGFLLIGLFIKAMLFPFHTLTIDMKEVPIPVAAILTVCTSFTTGGYLIIRLLPVFNLSHSALQLIYFIGLITMLYCSVCAIFQNNIRSIISYIVCCQVGLIFLLMSEFMVSVALFHYVVMVFSLVLLILLSGIIIKFFNGTQDIRLMGGLRSLNPYLASGFLIAIISVSGLFFGGLYSFTKVLNLFNCKSLMFEMGAILLTVFFVSFVCFRTYFAVFEGEKILVKQEKLKFPIKFSISLLFLAVIITGFWTYNFIEKLFDVVVKSNIPSCWLNYFVVSVICCAGAIFAWLSFKKKWFENNFVDKISNFLNSCIDNVGGFLIKNTWCLICQIADFIDRIIGGIENLIAFIIKLTSVIISKIQNSTIKSYIIGSIAGIIFAFLLVIFYYCKLGGV